MLDLERLEQAFKEINNDYDKVCFADLYIPRLIEEIKEARKNVVNIIDLLI